MRDARDRHAACPSACMQGVLACVLPLREENHMKTYLLLSGQRAALLAQHGGRLHVVAGTSALEQVLQVCCMEECLAASCTSQHHHWFGLSAAPDCHYWLACTCHPFLATRPTQLHQHRSCRLCDEA